MAKTFQCPAQITGISTKADRSLSIRLTTDREMSAEEAVLLMSYVQQSGWFLFRANEFTDEDVPAGDARDSRKTPSQRLRGVLYRVFELTGKTKGEFDSWYVGEMERIIDHYKAKLE
jgi:hypothetical protein